MLAYWLLFLFPAYFSATNLQPKRYKFKPYAFQNWPFLWWCAFICLILIIGFRYEIGGDWLTYLDMLKSYEGESESNPQDYGFQDPAFVALYLLAANTGLGIYLVNLISAGIFSYGLISFCLAQPRPWLALVVAIPYLVTVVSMGYTRQSAAIGLVMVALLLLGKGRTRAFLVLIAIASTFHKSALVLIVVIFLNYKKNYLGSILILSVISFMIYDLLMKQALDILIYGYIDSAMQSSGAGVRISMNVIAALFFIVFRKRFKLTSSTEILWSSISWLGLLLIIAFFLSPSSTAVDRVALYWIPLQLFVLSRIPDLFNNKRYRQITIYLIVAYSASVHFVWLFFADTSFAWLPYQFYPWVLLMQ